MVKIRQVINSDNRYYQERLNQELEVASIQNRLYFPKIFDFYKFFKEEFPKYLLTQRRLHQTAYYNRSLFILSETNWKTY